MKTPEGLDIREIIRRVRLEKDVDYAEPNYKRRPLSVTPNDPHWGSQWGMVKAGLPSAWMLAQGSREITVAVLDTGVDYEHPDLKPNMGAPDDDDGHEYENPWGWNFCSVYDWETGVCSGESPNPMDQAGHGTHVAGIIGAVGNNDDGVAGINWNIRILPLKFMSPYGDIAAEVKAIDYAVTMGARIINASFGDCGDITSSDPLVQNFSRAEYDAIKHAGEHGVLFVAAAGNGCDIGPESYDNDGNVRNFPSSYAISNTIERVDFPPLTNIIAVAATDRNDGLTPSSSYGATSVHLAAPGEDIYSTYLNDGYRYDNGTSMAAPFVAGAAALLWSKAPGAAMQEIKDAILQGVDTVPALNGEPRKVVTGGRLNVLRSLQLMQMSLNQGWNFVCLPKQPPSGVTLDQIFSGLSDKVTVVWTYDTRVRQWLRYSPNASSPNTLFSLEAGKGYWIYMEGAGRLDVSDWQDLPARFSVELHGGWNLAGYSGIDGQEASSGLNAILPKWSLIWTWDKNKWSVLDEANTDLPAPSLKTLRNGKAYWIKIKPRQTAEWPQ